MNSIKYKSSLKLTILVLLLACILSIINNILPIYTSSPSLIYSNIIPTLIVSSTMGPIYGSIFAVILSIIINSFGMGIGVTPYILIFQGIEAFLAGVYIRINFNSVLTKLISIPIFSIIFCIFIKPVSFILFYLFNKSMLNISIYDYISSAYATYLANNATNIFFMYLFSFSVAFIFQMILLHLTDK